MSTTTTTNLGLTKAVKGTAEPFSIDAVNANLDAIDSAVGAVGSTSLQEQVNALGEANLITISMTSNATNIRKSGCYQIGNLCVLSGVGRLSTSFPHTQNGSMALAVCTVPTAIAPSECFVNMYGYQKVRGYIEGNSLILWNDGVDTVPSETIFVYMAVYGLA